MAGWNAIVSLGGGGDDRLLLARGRQMSDWKPGDPRPDAASMLRVDQAGEYGATRIYAGQLAVLGRTRPLRGSIARMAGQEERHLERFDALMAERGSGRRRCSHCGTSPASRWAPRPR